MDVTKHIEELMDQRGWTVYRLGKESGISQSTLAHVFRRDSAPTIATLEIICRAFGITLSQFFAEGAAVSLTEEQSKLLERWSILTKKQRDMMWVMLDTIQSQE